MPKVKVGEASVPLLVTVAEEPAASVVAATEIDGGAAEMSMLPSDMTF